MCCRYVYADLYGNGMWAGTESPQNSGKFTSTRLNISCASDSPIPCTDEAGSSGPSLGFVFSFGQDNGKDIFIMASSGMYRVVRPSRCSYACAADNGTGIVRPKSGAPAPSPSPSTSTSLRLRSNSLLELVLLLWSFSLFSLIGFSCFL